MDPSAGSQDTWILIQNSQVPKGQAWTQGYHLHCTLDLTVLVCHGLGVGTRARERLFILNLNFHNVPKLLWVEIPISLIPLLYTKR